MWDGARQAGGQGGFPEPAHLRVAEALLTWPKSVHSALLGTGPADPSLTRASVAPPLPRPDVDLLLLRCHPLLHGLPRCRALLPQLQIHHQAACASQLPGKSSHPGRVPELQRTWDPCFSLKYRDICTKQIGPYFVPSLLTAQPDIDKVGPSRAWNI